MIIQTLAAEDAATAERALDLATSVATAFHDENPLSAAVLFGALLETLNTLLKREEVENAKV